MEDNRMLLKPDGVKDFLPAEAGAKREIENKIMGVLKSWGYQEVITPTLECGAIFSADIKSGFEEKTYRFFDGRGGTLVLRPDWTLPLARLVANHLESEPLPIRLAYQGNIFRFESPQSGKRREIFQAGGELIGAGKIEADVEVLSLALESLFAVGINDLRICVGHTGFLCGLLQQHGVSAAAAGTIAACLTRRDFASLRDYLETDISDCKLKESLSHLPELRGSLEAVHEAAKLLPAPARERFLESMLTMGEMLSLKGLEDYIRFDFSFLRDLQYYTGFIFEIYTPSWGYPLGGGGRYNRLLDNFGRPLPAVGFALSIDYILSIRQQQGRVCKPSPDYFVAFKPSCYRTAQQKAQSLRSKGHSVVLDVKGQDRESGYSRAQELHADIFLYYSGEGLQEMHIERETAPGKGSSGV